MMWSQLSSLFFSALYFLVALGIALVVISENRNPIKAIAWVLVVILMPAVGIVLYYFFGRDLRRTNIVHRRVYRRFKNLPYLFKNSLLQHDNIEVQEAKFRPIAQLCEHLGGAPLLPISDVDIYTQGEDMFAALLADLRGATRFIHMQFYAFLDDRIGSRVAEILMAKAREGVHVRLLYDDVGSISCSNKFWQKLRAAGVQVYPFMRVIFPILSSRINYRNHRKLVIIDGDIGYIGGMNVADRYYYGNQLGLWRDTHIRFRGVGVAELQSIFLTDWYLVTRRVVYVEDLYLQSSLPTSHYYNASCIKAQFFAGSPLQEWRTIEQVIISIVLRATHHLYIETPYFLPTQALCKALTIAVLGGVEVVLIIPKHGDVKFSHYASCSYIDGMLEAGVKVYFYHGGFLHSKLITADSELTLVGSANMDFRSFEHNFEDVGVLYDAALTKRFEEKIQADLHQSELVEAVRWKKRKRSQRLLESVLRLFSPLL